jgi:hypothetical protein
MELGCETENETETETENESERLTGIQTSARSCLQHTMRRRFADESARIAV